MRLAAAFALLSCITALPVRANHVPSLAVIVEFEKSTPHSLDGMRQRMDEMRREMRHLLGPAGFSIDVRLRSEVKADDSFDDLLMVRMKGDCSRMPDPMLVDERGPQALAYAHVEGAMNIQPFAVVACDAVRRAVESALWGGQKGRRNELMGRALGRVVAHELLHVLAKTAAHGRSGAFRASLTGAQLISDGLAFDPRDLALLRPVRAAPEKR